MRNSLEATVRKVMGDVLGLAPNAISEGTSMDSIGTWDSLAHINLMTALEQEFGIALEIEEIESMRSFARITAVLQRKL